MDYYIPLLDEEDTGHPFLDLFCKNFAWYRRWIGGHWERWIIDYPVVGEIWYHTASCSKGTGARPPLGRATPVCEQYPPVV